MLDAFRHESHDRHYLKILIDKCDPLDLSPIEETHPQADRPGEPHVVTISKVYTELYLARLSRRPGEDLAALLRGEAEARDPGPGEGREEREPISAREAITVMPRLVLLGQPGGGKSSLVNYLVVQLARRYLGDGGEELPGWEPSRKPLPVRIILRRFAAWLPEDVRHGDAGHVWDYIEHQLGERGLQGSLPEAQARS